MRDVELKPCPFCGAIPVIVKDGHVFQLKATHKIDCFIRKIDGINGNGTISAFNYQCLVKDWNKRFSGRDVPRKRFQGRCAVCELDLLECDWGDEMWTLQDDLHKNFKYCPRCGQRIDWDGDDYYDNVEKQNEQN